MIQPIVEGWGEVDAVPVLLRRLLAEERMRPGLSYSETADPAALTAQMDLARAFARCRSFRRMVTAFGRLATSPKTVCRLWEDWKD